MTNSMIQQHGIKDTLTGILLCMLIITLMFTIPAAAVFAWIMLPLPVLFFRLKSGRRTGITIVAASLCILVVSTSHFALNTIYFGTLLLTGLFLGEFMENHMGVEKIILSTLLCVFGTGVFILFVYSLSLPQGLDGLFTSYAERYKMLSEQLFTQTARLYPEMEIDPRVFSNAGAVLLAVFPGIFINSYLSMILINILAMKKILSKKGIRVNSIENLNQWRASEYLVLMLIGLAGMMFLSRYLSGSFGLSVKILAVNSLIVLLCLYLFQGIAIVSFFFVKKRAPIVFRLFVYVLIAVQPLFMLLVVAAGLFDTWFNFRKIGTIDS